MASSSTRQEAAGRTDTDAFEPRLAEREGKEVEQRAPLRAAVTHEAVRKEGEDELD